MIGTLLARVLTVVANWPKLAFPVIAGVDLIEMKTN